MGISKLAVENLMKKNGAERVSEDAKEEMIKILEEHLYKITLKALRVSQHSKRKTIKESDIVIAIN